MLVSPSGAVVLLRGDAPEADADWIAQRATALGAGRAVTSFRAGVVCVHAAPVCHGWTLCVLSTLGVHPSFVIERLRRASHVLALALEDRIGTGGRGGSSDGGAPAEVFSLPIAERKR